MDHLPAEIGLPMVERVAVDQLFLGAEEIGRGHDVVIAGGSIHGFEVTVPIDGGRQGANLRQAHFVVDVFGIAALDVIHLGLRQRGFEFDDRARIGGGLRFRLTCQREHLLQMRAVLDENFFRLVVGLQIVVTIGKAESGLIDLCDHHRGIVVVLLAGEAEERRTAFVVSGLPGAGINMLEMGDLERNVFLPLECGHAREF